MISFQNQTVLYMVMGFSMLDLMVSQRAFASEPKQLSHTQIVADLEQLNQIIKDNHPNPFNHSSEHSFAEQLRLIGNQFEDGGTSIDFYAATAPILAALQDVHTRLIPSGQNTYQLPLHLDVDSAINFLPVSPIAIRALPKEGQLLEINGRPLSDIRKDILAGVSGAQLEYREAYLRSHLMDYMNSTTAWGASVDLTFCIPVLNPLLSSTVPDSKAACKINGQDGYREFINIPTLPSDQAFYTLPNRGLSLLNIQGLFSDLTAESNGEELMVEASVNPVLQPSDVLLEIDGTPINGNHLDHLNASDDRIELLIQRNQTQMTVSLSEMPFPPLPSYDFEPISPEVMRLNIWQFEDQEAFRSLLDDMFQRMRKRGQGQLVIDLRESEGEHSALINTFYAYVADEPMHAFQYREVRRNAAFKKERPGLYFIMPMMFPWKVDGLKQTYRIPFKAKPPFERSRRFRGDIVVLTSVNTLSTAASFAAVLSDYDRALLVGEETGGAACPTGGVSSFSLQHTKLEGHVSRYIYGRPSGDCRDGGVQPHRVVSPEEALETAKDILYLKRAD